jgi:hypothetical protein
MHVYSGCVFSIILPIYLLLLGLPVVAESENEDRDFFFYIFISVQQNRYPWQLDG